VDGPEPGKWAAKVLVVEDCAATAELLARFLRQNGFAVALVGDGRAALEQVRATEPDVVLLDIDLPGIDGWELAEQLQHDHFPKRPLIVAITGFGDEEAKRRSEQVGIDLHLTKPADLEGLRRLLTRFSAIIAPQ
jgi:CheY-like chemotaxis protein